MGDDIAAALVFDGSHADLPEPWTFDGTRRVYVMGKPAQRNGWIARAVDVSDKTFARTIPLQTGEGDTPMEAVIDLVRTLQGIEVDASDDAVFIARGEVEVPTDG